jgi:hypothetical protein
MAAVDDGRVARTPAWKKEKKKQAGRQLLAAPRAPRPLVDEAGGRNGVVRLAAAVAWFIYI